MTSTTTPSTTTPSVSKIEIAQLPTSLNKRIDVLKKQEAERQKLWGQIQILAFFILTSFGATFALYAVFAQTFVPWKYMVCVIAFVVGGLAIRKDDTDRQKRQQEIRDIESCIAELNVGRRSLFLQQLHRAPDPKFTIEEVLTHHRHFKTLSESIQS